MKHTTKLIIMLAWLLPAVAFAATDNTANKQTADCDNNVELQVNGLVCDFCARAFEKVIGEREEVAGISVSIAEGMISVAMNPGADIDDNTLSRLVADSGYDLVAINRRCAS